MPPRATIVRLPTWEATVACVTAVASADPLSIFNISFLLVHDQQAVDA